MIDRLPVSQLVVGALRAFNDLVTTTASPDAFVMLDSAGSLQASEPAAGEPTGIRSADFATHKVPDPFAICTHEP